MPYVPAALDGSQTPYKPNNGEHSIDLLNYKLWASLKVTALMNSLYLFTDMACAWSGKSKDKICAKVADFMTRMEVDNEPWIGK
jgi:hypothetical protein